MTSTSVEAEVKATRGPEEPLFVQDLREPVRSPLAGHRVLMCQHGGHYKLYLLKGRERTEVGFVLIAKREKEGVHTRMLGAATLTLELTQERVVGSVMLKDRQVFWHAFGRES